MDVRSVYRQDLLTAAPDEALTEAASRMDYDGVGALAVVEHQQLVGIITERDLLRAMAEEVELAATTIGEYMTADVVTVERDTALAEAAVMMIAHGTRHLPVVEAGHLLGMLSARDVLIEEAALVRGGSR